jgi:hypothetical protein
MQKVYLLLRNNQQTGPFNLEELIRFDLKPYDLIWIEGKSAGWYYPQEIKELHSHLPFLKQVTPQPVAINPIETKPAVATSAQPKKVFVSMPSYTKEPTPKPSFTSSTNFQNETPKFSQPFQANKETQEVKTSYAKSIEEVETDYMNWAYQKKAKKRPVVSLKGAIAACLVVGIAFAGWRILKTPEQSKEQTPLQENNFVSAQNELATDSTAIEEAVVQNNKPTAKKEKHSKTTVNDKPSTTVKQQLSNKPQGSMVASTVPVESNDYESTTPITKEEKEPVIEEKTEPVITEAPKEKKKLRDKIFDLFKKKPEDKKEVAKPVEEEDGKRNSTRREAGANLAQMVTVKFDVPNDWMMGIKGAKATLTNRSSEIIVKAVVEVVYYNDDNDILARKTISFSDIKSKQTKTVAVPEHSTATRLEYNVISAVGANEPFASL